MKKIASSPLVLISGLIILILGGLNILAWIILLTFFQSIETPPQFFIPILEAFMNLLKHPSQIVILLLTVVVGIIFVVASQKMKKPEKLFRWSVVSLVLGLIILFELRGGNVFGGTTAGILSSVGGVFGLIESTKKS
jgi:Na+/melibiose symporter-like transporter